MPRASAGGAFAHKGLFAMAATYAFHIAQNQPLVDGNKRTDLLAAIVFDALDQGTRADAGQVALAWVLRRAPVNSALIGASRPSQVDGLRGATKSLALGDAEPAEIDRPGHMA